MDLLDSEYHVRVADASDFLSITILDQHSNPYPWSESLLQDALVSRRNWVVETLPDRQIVGWLTASQVMDQAELEQIVCHIAHRRKGLGKALMRVWLEWCDEQSMYECLLEVRESNAVAIALYQQLGFAIVGCRKNYYPLIAGGAEAAVLMTRSIVNK